MRKYIVTLLLFSFGYTCFAQDVDELFCEFQHKAKAEYISVSPFLMKFAKIFASGDADSHRIIRKVKAVKVLDLEGCKADVRNSFAQKADSYIPSGYEELMRMNDDGDKIRILMKMKKEKVRELLLMFYGEDDCMMMQVKGKLKKEDIDKLVNNDIRKKHGCH